MTNYLHITLLLIVILLSLVGSILGQSAARCQAWTQVVQRAKADRNINTTCKANVPNCEGVNCEASYSYKGPFSGFRKYHEDFGVGMRLEECQRTLLVNLSSYSKNIYKEYSLNTTSNQDDYTEAYALPEAALRVDLPYLGRKTLLMPFIEVKMTRICKNDDIHYYTRIGVKVKVRLGNRNFYQPLERQIIPESDIPAEKSCDNLINSMKCVDVSTEISTVPWWREGTTVPWIEDTTVASTPTLLPVTGDRTSGRYTFNSYCDHNSPPCNYGEVCTGNLCICKTGFQYSSRDRSCLKFGSAMTYGKPCKFSPSFDKPSCGQYELCTSGRCACYPDFTYSYRLGQCVGSSKPGGKGIPGKHNHTAPQPHSVHSLPAGPSVNKKTVIIAVCVTVGVLVLGAILAVVVFKYYKFKQRYGNHDLLMQSEEDVVI